MATHAHLNVCMDVVYVRTYARTYGRAVYLVSTCLCREAFRTFFGEPSDKDTYIRVSTGVPAYWQFWNCVSCSSFLSHVDTLLRTSHLLSPFPGQLILGLPIFLKFAGAAIVALKRWLHAEEVDEDSEAEIDKYFSTIHTPPYVPRLDTFAYTPLTLVEKKPVSCSVKSKPSSTSKKINKGDMMWAEIVRGCVTALLGSVSRPNNWFQSGNWTCTGAYGHAHTISHFYLFSLTCILIDQLQQTSPLPPLPLVQVTFRRVRLLQLTQVHPQHSRHGRLRQPGGMRKRSLRRKWNYTTVPSVRKRNRQQSHSNAAKSEWLTYITVSLADLTTCSARPCGICVTIHSARLFCCYSMVNDSYVRISVKIFAL